MNDLRRGDVVLVAFPFVYGHEAQRKRRPALVVQSDRYNRRRDAVILAALTTAKAHRDLPCKIVITRDSVEGRRGGLRLDSVVDCQTLVTLPREEIVARLGRFSDAFMARVDTALADALGIEQGKP